MNRSGGATTASFGVAALPGMPIASAAATRIANEAHAADPSFYQFLKTLDTYRAALDGRTNLVLSAESAFLRLLTQGLPEAPRSPESPVASKSPVAPAPASSTSPEGGR